VNRFSVDIEILKTRFQDLRLTKYELAKRVSDIRASLPGGIRRRPGDLVTSVDGVIKNPNTSQFKNVEAVVKAMGGELFIRWENTEQVVTSQEEVKL
jgi:hypothetical protein